MLGMPDCPSRKWQNVWACGYDPKSHTPSPSCDICMYIYINPKRERERDSLDELLFSIYLGFATYDRFAYIYIWCIYIYTYIYICILNCTYIYSCKYPWHPNDRKADAQGVRQDLVPEDLVLTQQQQRWKIEESCSFMVIIMELWWFLMVITWWLSGKIIWKNYLGII